MPQHRLRKRYLETSRGLIHAQESGEGPTLVLITLTSFAAPLLEPVLPELARLGWHAMALDLMGYGRSDKRNTHWLVEDFADNMLEAIADSGSAPVGLVCGHFSSWTGIEIAARRATDKTLLPALRGLVLDGTPVFTAEQRTQRLAEGPPEPQTWTDDGAHALAYWQKVWRILQRVEPGRALDPVPSQRFREAVMCLMEASVYEPNTAMAAAYFDIQGKLPLIDLPTLVMCADTDWNLPHFDTVMAALPNPRPLRLPGVHPIHALHAPERAVAYAAHLHGFFSTL
jgi:pimeloyl-ACP methyl ester carboxylesterase